MEKYIGVKVIEAKPMRLIEAEEHLQRKIKAGDEEGYLVIYEGGYESWSPKKVFEEAYRPTNGMNFGLAIEAMKKGYRVARRGWNGKGMFLYYVSEGKYPAKMESIKGKYENDLVPYDPYIAMKTANDTIVPWLASQTDILSDDWVIIE